ncbi:MAG: zinc ribbon domain-containing protein [Terriglobia bacterium]
MERRTSTNEVKVFKFGAGKCKGQIENEDLALDQIWLQNRYRNALVAIDRKFRGRYNAIVGENNPAIDRIREIGARTKELRATIRVQRTGVQRAGWKALSLREKDEIKDLTAERKALKPEADRVKLSNKTTHQPRIKALNKEFFNAIKLVKADFSAGAYVDDKGHDLHAKRLFWMNEEHVYNNFLKDRDAAMRDKTVLKFHRFEPEGAVTVRPRVQAVEDSGRRMTVLPKATNAKPLKVSLPPGEVAAYLASNPGAKLARADIKRFKKLQTGEIGETQKVQRNITAEQAFQQDNGSAFHFTLDSSGGEKISKRGRRITRGFAYLQIGTDPKTFFALPVVLHRPFPEATVFKSVAAKRERVGRHCRWSLLVTVDFPAQPPSQREGVVALDPGWAVGTLPEPDGRLRVGGLTSDDGTFKELCLPPAFMSQVRQVSTLQSKIAEGTNAIMPKAQEWLDGHNEQTELRTHFQNALRAHSNAKRRQREAGGFRHLIKGTWTIRNGTKPDGHELRSELEGWYKSFRHLDEWMRNLADQNAASKLYLYRNWASAAAKRYRTVVIDDCDLRAAAEAPAEEKDRAQVAGGQRQMAAPSLLVAAFVNAFTSLGGEVRWVLGKTSRTCSECAYVNPALGPGRTFKCEGCGYTADREHNSGRNLIRWHQEGRSTAARRSTKVRKPTLVLNNQEVFVKPSSETQAAAVESVR